jgi:signal transduction histidine kinase
VKVLIVDGRPKRRRWYSDLLVRLEHRPVPVPDVVGALEALHSEPADMILVASSIAAASPAAPSDPAEEDGLELCRRLTSPDLPWERPVLVLTDGSSPELVRRCLEAGASDTLASTATQVEVAARIMAHLRQLALMRELVAAEKQLALGRLMRGLCHEILNPLTILIGNLEILLGDLDRQGRDAALLALGQAQAIGLLTRQARRFASVDPSRLLPVEMRAIVDEASSLVRLGWTSRTFTITKSLPDELPLILGDQEKLCLALVGLLNNAVSKLPPSGGQISIEAGASGSHAWLAVRDDGAAIPPEELAHLFDPFRPKAPSAQSTLGLPVTRQLVEEHHGRVDVQSWAGQGSLFTIYLPVAPVS